MELDFALLADGVTHRPDGKLDIYGAGFDTINATNVPAQHARLVFAARIFMSAHETEHQHRIDVLISGADGDVIARATGSTGALPPEERESLPAGRSVGVGIILNFENIVFPTFGAYQVVIQWDGTEIRNPLALFVEPTPQ